MPGQKSAELPLVGADGGDEEDGERLQGRVAPGREAKVIVLAVEADCRALPAFDESWLGRAERLAEVTAAPGRIVEHVEQLIARQRPAVRLPRRGLTRRVEPRRKTIFHGELGARPRLDR